MALLGILQLIALAIFKASIGYFTGIVVLVADALSSVTDLLTLFASYVGLKISQRRADKNFKYGYYRAETFAAFVTSVIIIYFGFDILWESIQRINQVGESREQGLAILAIIVSTLSSLYLARFLKKVGENVNSLALIDSAKEKKMDIVAQVAVLIGVGANYYHIPYLEGSIGVIISLLTLKVGYGTARESLFFLLDYFDDEKLIQRVKNVIHSKSHIVKEIRDIRMRRAGTFIFGEAFLEVNPYAQTKDIRSELKNLKAEISKTSEYLKDFLLFIDVPQFSKIKMALPVKEDVGLSSAIAKSFDETKAYIFVEIKDMKIANVYGKKFPYPESNFQKIVSFLEGEKIQVVINNNMQSLLYYHLRRLNHINVYPQFDNVNTVENTVKLFLLDT